MIELSKLDPDEEMVTLNLRVKRSVAEKIEALIAGVESESGKEAGPWRNVIAELRPAEGIPSAILRGSRVKEEMTQLQLSKLTGIPRRHISEMEHGKRGIGKETAKKLAQALDCDYRVFL